MANTRLDAQALNAMVRSVVQDTFKQMLHVSFSAEPVVAQKEIIEYDGNMRIFPMEKFNGPVIVGVVNYYLSARELEQRRAVGTVILYVKEDVVERLFKAFGRSAQEAEEDAAVLDIAGELCHILAGNIKNGIRDLGLADLTLSAPLKYKNAVPQGVPFDYRLFSKQEQCFSFWNQKCIVLETCVGDIPPGSR